MKTSDKFRRILFALSAFAGCLAPGFALACVDGAPKGEAVTIQQEAGPMPAGKEQRFHVLGAGWFRAAEVVKEGGTNDATTVTVELDGEEVISASFASLQDPWMQLNTPYIVAKVVCEGNKRIMSLWYQPELKFRAILAVRVDVQEQGVQSLHLRAVMNKPGPHEDPVGKSAALSLPAFK